MATQTGPEETLYWKEYICFLIKISLLDEALQVLDEAEDHTYGADLLFCRAVVYYLQKNKRDCMDLLEEALLENFDQHTIMFEIAPELKLDKDIASIIKYFSDEEHLM